MQLRNLTPETQRSYIHYVAGFARYFHASPDQLDGEAIHHYLVYLLDERKFCREFRLSAPSLSEVAEWIAKFECTDANSDQKPLQNMMPLRWCDFWKFTTKVESRTVTSQPRGSHVTGAFPCSAHPVSIGAVQQSKRLASARDRNRS
jgi:hypothetical protein